MVLAESRQTDGTELKAKKKKHPYRQIIFDKESKNTQQRKESLFNKWCWKNWKSTCKRIKLDYSLSNIQKVPAFLYTNKENSEREMKETIPFVIETKRIKYLKINLTKDVKDLYTENYNALLKEI